MSQRRYEDDGRGKVYIGNIPAEMTENELVSEFERYGRVERCWIAKAPPGFAFVWFSDTADAEAAVSALDDSTIKGRVVKVEIARASRGPRDYSGSDAPPRRMPAGKGPGGYRVKISGLPPGVDWREIKDTFRKSGEVAYANVQGDEGIAEFSSERDREQAIRDFDDTTFRERRIAVEKIEGSSAEHFARRAARSARRYDDDDGYAPPPRGRRYDDDDYGRSRSPPSRRSYRDDPPRYASRYYDDRPRDYDRGYDRAPPYDRAYDRRRQTDYDKSYDDRAYDRRPPPSHDYRAYERVDDRYERRRE